LGGMVYAGEAGNSADMEKARALFEKSCKSNSPDGCYAYAGMLYKGEGGKKEQAMARSMFDKSCNGKCGDGCFGLGVMMFHGEGGAKSPEEAKEIIRKACKLGSPQACALLKQQ